MWGRLRRICIFWGVKPRRRCTRKFFLDETPGLPFENHERIADYMRGCKGKVMVSINDPADIRRVFEGFHLETVDIRYGTANPRQAKAEVTGELVIMNWEPNAFGGLF